jgi:hypothetical protein
MLSISTEAVQGIQGQKAMRLQGLIQKQEILILVDSGSSSTFISASTVSKLNFHQEAAPSIMVTVANGSEMTSNTTVAEVVWLTQGHTFTTAARVLDIQHYDMILGMDWLEQFSPMWVHWRKKKMKFNYKASRILLNGVRECTSTCPQLKIKKLKGMLRKGSIQQQVQLSPVAPVNQHHAIPEEIQQLVNNNVDLFQEPRELPPQRHADHHIPLLPGAQPVNSKPYTPAQKDEIERQVKELLLNAVIQPSASPFSSPVLLVKKKDGS